MAAGVLLQEGREGVLRLGTDAGGDAGRDHVEDDDPGVVVPGERVGEFEGELGVGAAADGDEDPLDLAERALLDDRDVTGRRAHDSVDRGREDGAGRVASTARTPAPPEDEQIGVHLVRRLDDPLRRPAPDPDERPDPRPLRGVVQDLLEEAPRLPRQRRAVGEGDVLGDLHDPEDGQLARPRIHDLGADPHEVLGGRRVCDGDEDAGGERCPPVHAGAPNGVPAPGSEPRSAALPASASAARTPSSAARQRSTR